MFPLTVQFGDAAKGTLQVRECRGVVQNEGKTVLIVTGPGHHSDIQQVTINVSIEKVLEEMRKVASGENGTFADLTKFAPTPS